MNKSTKIYIAGHRGMVGSAVWSALESKGYNNLIGKTSKELDLRNQAAVSTFFETEKWLATEHLTLSLTLTLTLLSDPNPNFLKMTSPSALYS